MSPQSGNSKDALAASNLVNEGLTVFAKDYLSQNPLSDAYDDEDDLVIVNNNEDFDFDDDDEDEFQDVDDFDKKDRPASGATNSKVNTGKSQVNPMTASSYRHFQQMQSAKLESQIQSLEEEMKSKTDNYQGSKQMAHDITNDQPILQKSFDAPVIGRSTSNHQNGLIGKNELPLRTKQGLVLYSFEPENPGELAVDADDVIEVISIKGEWIECLTKDRRHGWVPFNYVHIQE